MSLTSIQVHLPAHSHSFNVSISSDSTIQDFKHAISTTCPGNPHVSGQRIIYRGRVLNDSEHVRDIWKPTEVPHVCHLAVHPSAWTSVPPNSTIPPQRTNGTQFFQPSSPSVVPGIGSYFTPPPAFLDIPNPRLAYLYIQYMHINALRILFRLPRTIWPEQNGSLQDARAVAKRGVEAAGRGWPSLLNIDFPDGTPQGVSEGVLYSFTQIDNLPYLSLRTPNATPTPIQSHAIRVLSFTFPLLCIYPRTEQPSNLMHTNPVAPGPIAPFALPRQAGIERIPIRPLILPLVMLFIRTCLLLYFFQPTRKPLIGIMVLLWMFWELAGAIRAALAGENPRRQNGVPNGDGARAAQPNQAPGNGAGPAPPPPRGAAAPRQGGENNTGAALPATQDAVLNKLSQINLSEEAKFVEPGTTSDPGAPPPMLFHKIKTFFILLFLTLHPAIWDRRRTALHAREVRVREDARTFEARVLQRMRERAEREENRRRGMDISAQPEVEVPAVTPKPIWVMEYVRRVRAGDWVDD